MKRQPISVTHPELLEEWDYEENEKLGLDPTKLTAGSGKIAYWICKKCGNKWHTAIYNRTNGYGCRKCGFQKAAEARKKPLPGKSLAEEFPEIAKEWNYKENGDLTPFDVNAHSKRKVTWICKFGHEWEATVYHRTSKKGTGCPVCHTLAFKHPELLEEWDYEANEKLGLDPEKVSYGSGKMAFWICKKCGNKWPATIYNRISGYGCPKCGLERTVAARKKPQAGKSLAEEFPEIAKQWNQKKNGNLTPSDVTSHSGQKVWWTCEFGHDWEATVHNRTSDNRNGCPVCRKEFQTSFPEQAIFYYLQKALPDREVLNRFQFISDNGKKYEIDIFIPSLNSGIEYDGKFWHQNKEESENKKNEALAAAGIRLIRLKESSSNKVDGDIIFYHYLKGSDYKYLPWAITEAQKMIGIKPYAEIDLEKDSVKILEQYKNSFSTINFAAMYPEIAKEWNYEKNGSLRPGSFLPNSNTKVWWKCPRCGHEWYTDINHRTSGEGCPVCAGRVIKVGYNDLQSRFPDIATEWDYERNGDLKPTDVTAFSDKIVWWKCKKCGYPWQTPPSRRTSNYKSGCPCCAGKVVVPGINDLNTLFPEIAKEWDEEKNPEHSPSSISPGSHYEAYWKCTKCGNGWQTAVYNRTGHNHTGCPYCAGKKLAKGMNDLATLYPDIAAEWDTSRNNGLLPSDVLPGSNYKAHWKCLKCGNEWQTPVYSRTGKRKSGCPKCKRKAAAEKAAITRMERKKNKK